MFSPINHILNCSPNQLIQRSSQPIRKQDTLSPGVIDLNRKSLIFLARDVNVQVVKGDSFVSKHSFLSPAKKQVGHVLFKCCQNNSGILLKH